jgi:hypothetical protein
MSLRHLALVDFGWLMGAVVTVLPAWNLSCLEELTLRLELEVAADATDGGWRASFFGLQRLHTLNLGIVGDADALLAACTEPNFLPVLTHLSIFTSNSVLGWKPPASTRLRQVLLQHPSLHLKMQLRPLELQLNECDDDHDKHTIREVWQRHHSEYQQLVLEHPARVELCIANDFQTKR